MTWLCRGGNSVLALGVTGVVLALLAASCATPPSTTPYGPVGPVPPAVTSTLLRPTVEQGAVDLYLSSIRAQETLEAARALQTATAVAGNATATRMAWAYSSTPRASTVGRSRVDVTAGGTGPYGAAWGVAQEAASNARTTPVTPRARMLFPPRQDQVTFVLLGDR